MRRGIAAALLHEIGRSSVAIRDLREAGVEGGEHGAVAGAWLGPLLGERVAWLAEQHVPAKRCLVATDPAYKEFLTGTSRHALEKQGGPMSAEEVEEFESHPQWREAVELRRWDGLGKDPGAKVPPLGAYEAICEASSCLDKVFRVPGAGERMATFAPVGELERREKQEDSE